MPQQTIIGLASSDTLGVGNFVRRKKYDTGATGGWKVWVCSPDCEVRLSKAN